VNVRTVACVITLWLTAAGAHPAYATELPRIIVGFANAPHTLPGPAGATGSHYGGDGYREA
jgi:hypothetical protein